MVFVALKPCRFGGTDYLIGDSIPADNVLPERVEALRAMGIISIGFEEVINQLNESVIDAASQHTADREAEPAEAKDGETENKDEERPKPRGRRKAE